ncbi:diguanylate cyclase domain-containing protein [Pseudoflavonifractor sp. MSJ-37]|uniref:diguanylate cyclase domain-containing protein n=1 Tax=Pseudoflavonifractor sp. MSJ-37 TaxID=2841531 RepID=UPI0035303493
MKTHTVVGAAMLKDVPVSQDEPLVKAAHEICRWHHERWDGRGYPDGLKGDEIPISAQVVALADVYDALTSERCYKKAFDHDTAVRMILNGECGAFAPLLMECLSEVREALRREMGQMDGKGHDHEKEARRLSNEILQGEALPKSDRPQRMLDMERTKSNFFSAMTGGIRFDYDVASGWVSMTEWDRDGRCHDRRMDLKEARDFRILSQSDQERLLGLVGQATVQKPEVQMTALLPTGRSCRWHRIDVLTIWSKEPPYQRIGMVGLIVDIHDGAARQRALALGLGMDSTADAAKTIQSLSEVFDLVRLVDPVKTEVLELGEDGALKSAGTHCYGVWTARDRCDDCVSAAVFQDHGCQNKLQFANNEIYHVIARYAEVDGRPCVLEMVSKLDEGPWVDNGGKRLLLEKVADCREDYFLDPVSGAYSRRYFENYAARLETADGVMMIDVDDFKTINDEHGHPVGDEALHLIADTVRACVRETDMLVRFGGDEFLLVFSDHISRDAFWERMGTIKQKVSQLVLPDYPALRLSISIGGAYQIWPLAEAIKQADRQMYEDKRRPAARLGRGRP